MAALKPVSKITDRAKRYRANSPARRPQGKKQCFLCGSKRNVLVGHINGDESDGDPQNLEWTCKSCNTRLGVWMKRAGLGVRTRQFNAGKARGGRKQLMDAYAAAIKVMRGEWEGDLGKALSTIRSTPREIRSAYTSRTWPTRRMLYGPSGRQGRLFGGGDVPF